MKLEELVKHNLAEIKQILAEPDPYSVYEDYEDFKILLIRRLEFEPGQLGFRSEAFLLEPSRVFYFDRESGDFTQLENGYAELAARLERYYKDNQKIIAGYASQVEQLGEFLFERNVTSVFMDIWFNLKKDLSKLESYYYRNGIVYREFLKKMDHAFGDFTDEFKDIEDSIIFQASNIDTLNSRLDGIHHYYASIRGDRLNKTLLTLTVISGVFLPLNLIVGFFGINTPGLFFAQDESGTEKVLLLLFSVLIVCLVGIQLIHLIDKYILRFILGRYNFYHKIADRIDELSSRLKGN